MSCFGNQFFGEPPRPPCPPKTMLRWRRENVFARRETIWRVPTGDLLFPANIVFGGQGGRAPFQRRRKRTRVKGVFIFILQIVSFVKGGVRAASAGGPPRKSETVGRAEKQSAPSPVSGFRAPVSGLWPRARSPASGPKPGLRRPGPELGLGRVGQVLRNTQYSTA